GKWGCVHGWEACGDCDCGRAGPVPGAGAGSRRAVILAADARSRLPARRAGAAAHLRELPRRAAGRLLPPVRPARAKPGAPPGPRDRGSVRIVLAPGRTHLPHPARAVDPGPGRMRVPVRPPGALRGATA